MTIKTLVIAGATGFIGGTLTDAALAAGYNVTRLVRSIPEEHETKVGVTDVLWDPATGELDEDALRGAYGIVCLNGVSLFGSLWTEKYKSKLWNSRISSVRTLVDAMSRLDETDRPDVFVSGSAIGIYGPDSNDAVLDETSHEGTGFLADLCRAWEAKASRARELGIRTVNIRTGLVMGSDGGMLGIIQHLYRTGLGAQLGDGSSWMSTISIIDHVRAILFVLKTTEIEGSVNAVCPEPIRNEEWNKLLAKHLKRPALHIGQAYLRAPAFAMKLALRDLAKEAILASQRVVPTVLLDHGFEFTAPSPAAIFDQVLPQKKK